MKVIGLDMSLTSSGMFSCDIHAKSIKEGIPRVFQTEPVTTKKPKPDVFIGTVYERMWHTISAIYNLVEIDDIVFIEDYAMTFKGTGITAAEEAGTLKMLLWRKTRRYPFMVAASMLKKWATGSGNAKKEDIKLALYKKYGIEFNTTDEADAFVLADFGIHVLGRTLRKLNAVEEETLIKFQRSTVKEYGKILLEVSNILTK